MAINCFRYLGFKRLSEVDELTIPEYELLIKAHNLRQVDEELKIHQLAFLNMAVKSTRKNGKPIYNNFRKFFDYDKEIAKVKGDVKRDDRFADIGKFLKGVKK